MKQHPTDGTPITEENPVNNDNDGKTVAVHDDGKTTSQKLGDKWDPDILDDMRPDSGNAAPAKKPAEEIKNPAEEEKTPEPDNAPPGF